MKKIVSIAVLSVFVATGLGSMAWAEERTNTPPPEMGKLMREKHEHRMEEMMKDLGLSAEQEAQIKEMRQSHNQAAESLNQTHRAQMKEMKDELDKPSPDKAKVLAVIEELTSLHRQRLIQRMEMILAMKTVLTPEQDAKLRDKMEAKRRSWKEKQRGGYQSDTKTE